MINLYLLHELGDISIHYQVIHIHVYALPFALEFILPSEHRMQETHHSHDLDDYKVTNSFGVALQQQKTIFR